jgi:hypothetical protein
MPSSTRTSAGAASATDVQLVEVRGLSNGEFLERYARPGRVGLVGGADWVDRNIRRAQKGARGDRAPSDFSHAFLFEGERLDGAQWVIESDIDIRPKHVRLGVQENRLSDFYDARDYPNVAVLDFGLTAAEVRIVLVAALELLASNARYSLREIAGTLIALNQRSLRSRDNLLAREQSMYCSAFVQHCFDRIGIDLAPNVPAKNTTPEDIAHSPVPHTAYVMIRHRLSTRPWDAVRHAPTKLALPKVRLPKVALPKVALPKVPKLALPAVKPRRSRST